VAGQVKLYKHTFGHPIGWVFPLGRVWHKRILQVSKYKILKLIRDHPDITSPIPTHVEGLKDLNMPWEKKNLFYPYFSTLLSSWWQNFGQSPQTNHGS
jgi:hypothetical protein